MLDQMASVTDARGRLAETSALRRCLEGLEPAYVDGLSHGEIAGRSCIGAGDDRELTAMGYSVSRLLAARNTSSSVSRPWRNSDMTYSARASGLPRRSE